MAITLIIARHGNTFEKDEIPRFIGRRTDLPLTQEGRTQAHQFGKYLREKQIFPVAIYSSSLKRQKEMAEIVNAELGGDIPLCQDEALLEIDYGTWENLSDEEVKQKYSIEEYKVWSTAMQWPASFADSPEEIQTQLQVWLQRLRNTHVDNTTIVAVSSNATLRYLYSLAQAQEWNRYKTEKRMKELKVKTGNFCVLHIYPDHYDVMQWNLFPSSS